MGEYHTSQLSSIKQRPPATDLRGPKASADSLTPLRINLAPEYARDLTFNFFSSIALDLKVGSEDPSFVVSIASGRGPSELEGRSGLCKEKDR